MRVILWIGLMFLHISLNTQVVPDYVLVSDGWVDPVALENAGDGSGRLFVVEKQGLIWIISDPTTGSFHPIPFLDIKSKVKNGGERGLLGLAFHPEYPTKPYVYVNYTFERSLKLYSRVERYTMISDVNKAEFSSAKVIVEYHQPYTNHNGGDVTFGPDGFLYVATGDGGSANDPDGWAQDYTNLLGAILRLDVDQNDFPSDPNKNYAIPPDNPLLILKECDQNCGR